MSFNMATLCIVLTDDFPIEVRLAKPVRPTINVKQTIIKNDSNNLVLIRNFRSITTSQTQYFIGGVFPVINMNNIHIGMRVIILVKPYTA